MKSDDLGDRMKRYEDTNRFILPRRTYTIIRIDGKAFHTYTRGCDKPFDTGLIEDMQQTTLALCKQIQGCKFGYTQSDEISLVLTDFDDLNTTAWFDGNIQKITSVAASIATAEFNKLRLLRKIKDYTIDFQQIRHDFAGDVTYSTLYYVDPGIHDEYKEWSERLAHFDARVWTIPSRSEVLNYLLWRQNDASKNSISMVALSAASHKELDGKNSNEKQEIIFQKLGKNWNDYPIVQKRGSCIYKKLPNVPFNISGEIAPALYGLNQLMRPEWFIDKESPRFNDDWNWFENKIPQLK